MKKSDRINQLTNKIHAYFDVRDPYIVPRFEPQVDEHVMDMFEVMETNANVVKFKHLFNDKIYHAVIGELDIARLVRRRDVFLLALIRRKKNWRVWHMSPPYETVYF